MDGCDLFFLRSFFFSSSLALSTATGSALLEDFVERVAPEDDEEDEEMAGPGSCSRLCETLFFGSGQATERSEKLRSGECGEARGRATEVGLLEGRARARFCPWSDWDRVKRVFLLFFSVVPSVSFLFLVPVSPTRFTLGVEEEEDDEEEDESFVCSTMSSAPDRFVRHSTDVDVKKG